MEKKNEIQDSRSYYLKEFKFFDGENDITFNIVEINFDKRTVNIAVTDCGKIFVREYDLRQDKNGDFYFNYGRMFDEIHINEFETIND